MCDDNLVGFYLFMFAFSPWSVGQSKNTTESCDSFYLSESGLVLFMFVPMSELVIV